MFESATFLLSFSGSLLFFKVLLRTREWRSSASGGTTVPMADLTTHELLGADFGTTSHHFFCHSKHQFSDQNCKRSGQFLHILHEFGPFRVDCWFDQMGVRAKEIMTPKGLCTNHLSPFLTFGCFAQKWMVIQTHH